MSKPEQQLDVLRAALECGRVELRGSTSQRQQYAVDETAEHMRMILPGAWEAIADKSTVIPFQPEGSDALQPVVHDAAVRVAGYFGLMNARLQETPSGLSVPTVEVLANQFLVVSSLFLMTPYQFKRRHPVLVFSPKQAETFIREVRGTGFTQWHLRVMSERQTPTGKLSRLKKAVTDINGASGLTDSNIRRIAVQQAMPKTSAEQHHRAIERLTTLYARDPEVRASDIRHFVNNHGPMNAEHELKLYKERIGQLHARYKDNEWVDRDVVLRACRRSKTPDIFIERYLTKIDSILQARTDLTPKLVSYLARTYRDPLATISECTTFFKTDPTLLRRYLEHPTGMIWDYLQGKVKV